VILLVIPAIGLAVASIAAFFGRYVWWLDVLANFRAQFLVALVISGAVLFFSRFRKISIAVLVAAALNLIVVAPLYLGSPGESSVEAPSVRVMSFNLLSTNEEYASVIEYIDQTSPDVVLLHEASLPWETALESADIDYSITKARSEDLIFGTLVLVKNTAGPGEVVSYGFAETDPRAVTVEVQPPNWPIPVQILSSHPLAPTSAERASLRDAQLGFAAAWASDSSGAYVVAGDFNATPWSWPFRNLVDQGSLSNSQIGFGLQPTFAASSNPLFRVPIDHLLQSDDLLVRQRALGPPLGSDHFPLVVDLELVGGGEG
jgi:endonuclease/exonuclease/phosphatase (EEP) superfamily protein YafD